MNKKRHLFTPENYRKLAQNPFVDDKMLQFIKNRTRQSSSGTERPPADGQYVSGPLNHAKNHSRPVISEKAAKLIAEALKGLLRE